MASLVQSQKLLDRLKIEAGLHVPSDTGADIHSVLGYVDLRDFDAFAVIAQTTTSAGTGLNLLEIVSAIDTSGTNATVIKASAAVAQTNTTYYQVLECMAEEIAELGRASSLALRYVGARLTCDNTSTRVEVTQIRGIAKNQFLNLTASKTA